MPEQVASPASIPSSITYGRLKRRHGDYRSGYWEKLRALYRGGHHLFGNPAVMKELFPIHNGEREEVYKQRCTRASYEPYVSTIIGHLVDGLFQDPVRLEYADGEGSSGEEKSENFFDEFFEDASAPGGIEHSWNAFMRDQVKEAFQVGVAWTLIDTPAMEPGYTPETVADEERAGATDPYAVLLPAEEVINWKLDAVKELMWAMTARCEPVIETVLDDGLLIRETYHLYTREGWGRYIVEYHEDGKVPEGVQPKKKPDDKELVQLSKHGNYDYGGKVPIVRLDFTDGLWALDLLCRNLKAHFNMNSGLDWAIDRANFPQLYEFLAPELPGIDQPISEAQSEPDRAIKQKRGVGYVQVRGKDDRAEYLAAPTESFDFTQTRLDRKRDEIFRNFLAMALSQDNSAASIRRTAESKAQDKASISVILKGIGDMLIAQTRVVVDLVEVLRGEECEGAIVGFEKFDPIAITDAIDQNLSIDTLRIPSQTFQKERMKALARRFLHGDVEADKMAQIEAEIESNITPEMVLPMPGEPGGDPLPEDDAPQA